MKTSPAPKATKKRVNKAQAASRHKHTLDATARNVAISTELAPAVAIALLEKSEHLPGEAAPALDVLAAGVTPSDVEGNVRVQLLFENGAVLPVEMSESAGSALADGLAGELPKPQKFPRKLKT